jgi:hypothetical protein
VRFGHNFYNMCCVRADGFALRLTGCACPVTLTDDRNARGMSLRACKALYMTSDEPKVIEGMRVILAGEHAKRLFRRCEIIIDGSHFKLDECGFDSCTFTFEKAASATLNALQMMCMADHNFATAIGQQLGILRQRLH